MEGAEITAPKYDTQYSMEVLRLKNDPTILVVPLKKQPDYLDDATTYKQPDSPPSPAWKPTALRDSGKLEIFTPSLSH